MHIAIHRRRYAALLLAMLFAACSTGESKEPSADKAHASEAPVAAQPKEKTPVRLGFQKIGPPFLLKARDESLVKKLDALNAKPEWVEFPSGPALLEAVRAGAVDVGFVGETPPVFAQSGGVPFVYVAADPSAPKSEAILVQKDSKIKTVADLKGKKVALNRGSNVHYLLLRALEEAKLTLSDVQVTFLPPADARTAFEGGRVDAWVIWDPFQAAAEIAGARVLRDGEGLVDNYFYYVARRDFAEQHADLVKAVLDEYQTLSVWAGSHPEDASKLLAASSGVAYEALLLAEKRHVYGLLEVTPEILAKQQKIADAFRQIDVIPNAIKTSDAFLAKAAYKAP